MSPLQKNRLTVALGACIALTGTGMFLVRVQSHSEQKPSVKGSPAKADAPTLLVDTLVAETTGVQESNALSGQVEPYHIATVAAEVPNRILSRPVERGDRVVKGTVLASLDAESARTTLTQAQNALAQATAARRQAETDYTRAVVETDAGRQQAQAQVQQAQADEQRATAQLAQADAGERKSRSYTRAQELRQAEDALSQARTDEKLARIEQERYTYLVKQGAAPQQALDRTQATLDSTIARRQSAEQVVSLAKEGARQEDREVAVAQVNAANAGIQAAHQQVQTARAALRIANTRDTRLAVIRRQIEGLRAQEAQAADTVRQAQIALEKRIIHAPFAGRVLATLADVGDMMAPGTPVARIGEIARVKVTFNVPEASRPALCPGQKVTISADALPNRTFAGTLTVLGFQADPRSRAFPIEVTVANPDEALLPNMIARLRLNIGKSQSRMLVPASAVASEGAATYVFVIEAGRAVRRDVVLGAPVGTRVEVRSGLEAGTRIAATPQRLSEGAAVQVRAEENMKEASR